MTERLREDIGARVAALHRRHRLDERRAPHDRRPTPVEIAQHALDALQAAEIDPVLRAVLEHHSPRISVFAGRVSGLIYCDGCDMGCSCEAASWPCSTVVMIAEMLGVEIPGRRWWWHGADTAPWRDLFEALLDPDDGRWSE